MTSSAAELRAPLALRIFIGLVALAAVAFNAALMISDRAPAVAERLAGDVPQRLSDRLDASRSVDTGQLPGDDAIVHIGVWAIAALLIVLTFWRWWSLVPLAAAVFVTSAAVEVGQGRYSTSRAVERSDIVANGVGVAIGVSAAAACMFVWTVVSASIRGIRRRHR